jgi:hypothetical protein
MNFKTFFIDAAQINSPVAAVIALVTIGEMKDIAILFSAIIGTLCTAAITIWKIKNNRKD